MEDFGELPCIHPVHPAHPVNVLILFLAFLSFSSVRAQVHVPGTSAPQGDFIPKVTRYDLYVTDTVLNYTGKDVPAIAVNGQTPMPTLYFTEGDTAMIVLHNRLKKGETSLHWHGLILPNVYDGVPWLTTPPIKAGESYTYKFPLKQHGTYWYHSHTMLQEQSGMNGALIIRPRTPDTIPEPAHPMALPKPTDPDYGAYLVNAAGCRECHTKMEKGKPVGEPFAGGFEFKFPNGAVLRSPNITPDEATGIGTWDRNTFIRKFRQFGDSSYVPQPVDWKARDFQTVMPWTMYGGMTEQDLGAIYDYLHALKPVENKVQYWSPEGKPATAQL
jgi:hypothetical protein